MSETRQRVGQLGESLASDHLTRRGFRILERNYRTRWGELDIVAFDGRALVFCEVKARQVGPSASGSGQTGVFPLESVHPRKCQQVRRMAASWLRARSDHPRAAVVRFDAIGVTLDRAGRLIRLEHLEDAF